MNYLVPDLAPLAERHVLVFYDQRGSGRSTITRDTAQLTARQFIADLDALRAQLHLGPMTLLGHSWGGGLAAAYALAHPERVASLLMVDPMPARRDPWIEVFGSTLTARRDSAGRAQLQATLAARRAASDADYPTACRAYNAVFIRSYLGDTASLRRMRGDLCVTDVAALRNGSAVNAGVIGSLGAWDFRAALATLTTRMLVVHGVADPIPLAASQEWAASVPNARLFIVPGSGHFPHVERADLFFPAVESFLRGAWPASSVHP
jgi:proline iminopeptidase